jgi:hypothetical protein
MTKLEQNSKNSLSDFSPKKRGVLREAERATPNAPTFRIGAFHVHGQEK